MKEELEQKLFNDFPHLYPRVKTPQESCMFFGFECADGWYDLIRELSEKMTKVIKKHMENEPYDKDEDFPFVATQVKEKFGTLRFYMSSMTDEMEDLIYDAEEKSANTCEICGDSGSLNEDGYWLEVRCPLHTKGIRER